MDPSFSIGSSNQFFSTCFMKQRLIGKGESFVHLLIELFGWKVFDIPRT